MGLIVGKGMALTAGGIIIGLVASLGLTQFLSTFVFGIGSTDPVAFGAGTLILIAVALSGCYLPARRALRVDPVEALRSD